MYFGKRVFASPLQANVASRLPFVSTQIGDWSTPMNQMFGFAFAAFVVSPARLNPTVTMTSYFWSTKSWMSLAYSDAVFGTTAGGFAAPIAVAPSSAPLYEYSLKFLSSRVPMSVTTPIFRFDVAAVDAD